MVVVEHDLAMIRAADLLVDIGPGAGEAGGQVLYAGPPEGIAEVAGSVTGEFLSRPAAGRGPRARATAADQGARSS